MPLCPLHRAIGIDERVFLWLVLAIEIARRMRATQ